EVDWIFHLDCDAALVDFSGKDALDAVLRRHANEDTRALLSRDESGFAGSSRLSNMGTGLWKRTAWTLQLLEKWWKELDEGKGRNEQEVLEQLLAKNETG
ncbi:cspG, partial [Symbiodinium microadriaticum]